MKTCRHFRYQIPQELADELREADPLPCEVCDALPHRREKVASFSCDYSEDAFGFPVEFGAGVSTYWAARESERIVRLRQRLTKRIDIEAT